MNVKYKILTKTRLFIYFDYPTIDMRLRDMVSEKSYLQVPLMDEVVLNTFHQRIVLKSKI